MLAQILCPHCRYAMTDDGSLSGQGVACPNCAGHFVMPTTAVAVPVYSQRSYSSVRTRPQSDPIRRCAINAILWSVLFVPLGCVAGVAISQYAPVIGALSGLAEPWSPYLMRLMVPHVLLFGVIGLVLGLSFGALISALKQR